jgi:transcriptional regulator with XRE-family HTH domain
MTDTGAPEVAVMRDLAAVGAELRAVRTARGLSQRDVSRTAGMPEVAVSRVELGGESYSHSLVRHLAACSAALGYTLRLVLVADPATTAPSGDESPERGHDEGWAMTTDLDAQHGLAELIRQVASLTLSAVDGWTVYGSPGDCLARGAISYQGTDFTLLRNGEGRVLVHTAREWAAFLDGVLNGEFDDHAGLTALPAEGSTT